MRNLVLAVLGLIIIATTAIAQENQPKAFITRATCEPVGMMMNNIAKYKEEPLFEARTILQHVNGEWFEGKSMMFVNWETGTYSFVTLYPDGTACMQAIGREFRPYEGPLLYADR